MYSAINAVVRLMMYILLACRRNLRKIINAFIIMTGIDFTFTRLHKHFCIILTKRKQCEHEKNLLYVYTAHNVQRESAPRKLLLTAR